MKNSTDRESGGENETSRRSVLGKLGAGTISGLVGLSGHAVAESDIEKDEKAQDLLDTYSSESNVEAAVETHASGLINELHSNGDIPNNSISEIVGAPSESETTSVRVFPKAAGWLVSITLDVTESVSLAIKPTEEKAHAKIEGENGPSIITAEDLSSDSESTPTVGTNNHNGQCLSSYDVCYGGYHPPGSVTCTIIEVYTCDGGCISHPTSQLCGGCEYDDPYPCT